MIKKTFLVPIILFVILMFGVNPAVGKMVTLVPQLVESETGELIPDPDYWHVEGDVEFEDSDFDGRVEQMSITGTNSSTSGVPFNSAGLYLNWSRNRDIDISYVSGSIMIPDNYADYAYDDSLGITLQKMTDKNLDIQARIVWYAHQEKLAAQIFIIDSNNGGIPDEIGEAVYVDAEPGEFYDIVVQHRGNTVLLFVGDQLIRTWVFSKKQYGNVIFSGAYFWGFSYCDTFSCGSPGQPIGTVRDMVVRFKEWGSR